MKEYFFQLPSPLQLESGETLAGARVAYRTWGQLNATRDNVVWVCHALTANDDVLDWWPGLFGEGHFFDPADWFIVCANILGSCYGSTCWLRAYLGQCTASSTQATGTMAFCSKPLKSRRPSKHFTRPN
jgi:homoserine O-acetyltransferase